jgi:hypothetical protein
VPAAYGYAMLADRDERNEIAVGGDEGRVLWFTPGWLRNWKTVYRLVEACLRLSSIIDTIASSGYSCHGESYLFLVFSSTLSYIEAAPLPISTGLYTLCKPAT